MISLMGNGRDRLPAHNRGPSDHEEHRTSEPRQSQQGLPRSPSTPSFAMIGTITSAAIGPARRERPPPLTAERFSKSHQSSRAPGGQRRTPSPWESLSKEDRPLRTSVPWETALARRFAATIASSVARMING
jgi:hypothetical protein